MQLALKDLHWPKRKADSHKGHHGSFAVIGGADGMYGAALLAARAGLLAGAGRTYLASTQSHGPMVDMRYPEIMMRPPQTLSQLSQLDCVAIGPGLGQSESAHYLLSQFLASQYPLVLDADALNLIADNTDLMKLLQMREAESVMTPHTGESARLSGKRSNEIQQQRLENALHLATELNVICVLKGQNTVIAHANGDYFINPTGNAGLASGGSGDVLTGIIASLIAQGLSCWEAAKTGVYIHGLAADQLVANGTGPIGLRASEVAEQVRYILNHHD